MRPSKGIVRLCQVPPVRRVPVHWLPSAGVLAAQCRCIGCPVPVYWLPSAGVLAAQCRCIGCAVPVYWLPSAGVLAAQCRIQFSGKLCKAGNFEKAVVSCVVKTYWEQCKATDKKG